MTIWQFIFIFLFLLAGAMAVFAGLYIGYLIYDKGEHKFIDFVKDTFKKEKQ